MRELEKEKLLKFKQALKKGKDGIPDNLEAWLESYGIDFKNLSLNFIQNNFLENPQYMIGNEKNIEIVGEYIGLFLRNRRAFYHIPIIGITGSGKSLLIRSLQNIILQSGEDIKFRMYDASKFFIDDNENLLYDEQELTTEKQDVIFIDSCEQDKDIFDSLKLLSGKMGNAVYITAWTPEKFDFWSQDIEYTFPFSQKIILSPMDNKNFELEFQYSPGLLNDFGRLVWNINKVISLKNAKDRDNFRNIFGDDRFELERDLFKISLGIPSVLIKLFITSIRETFLKRREKLERKIIVDVARKMGIISIGKKLKKLSPPQLRLIETIILFSSEEGINPTKLAKTLSLDISTISYYLNPLKAEQILESTQTGRKISYKIKENLIPFIQLKLLKEFNYLKLNNGGEGRK
jgi:predicted transcriptional regulator